MTITLDPYSIPERGKVNLHLKRSFEIKVTAEEAQRQVSHWVFDEVSYLLRGLTPTLVIAERVVWRVPVSLGLPDLGQLGMVGVVDVDVETGAMDTTSDRQAALIQQAEDIASRLSPYQLKRKTPPKYLAQSVPPSPSLSAH